jgi:hypothetical protein
MEKKSFFRAIEHFQKVIQVEPSKSSLPHFKAAKLWGG